MLRSVLAIIVCAALLILPSTPIFGSPARQADTHRVHLALVLRAPASPNLGTPTPDLGRVAILANDSFYVTSKDVLHVVGEIHNQTAQPVRDVKISAAFFTADGRRIKTVSSYTFLTVIPAGEKTCFALVLDDPPGWATYTFERPTYTMGAQRWPSLALLNVSGQAADDDFRILGQVRNNEPRQVRFVHSTGTLYDAAGRVIDCQSSLVSSVHLAAGQASAFDLDYVTRSTYTAVTSFRVQADGQIDEQAAALEHGSAFLSDKVRLF